MYAPRKFSWRRIRQGNFFLRFRRIRHVFATEIFFFRVATYSPRNFFCSSDVFATYSPWKFFFPWPRILHGIFFLFVANHQFDGTHRTSKRQKKTACNLPVDRKFAMRLIQDRMQSCNWLQDSMQSCLSSALDKEHASPRIFLHACSPIARLHAIFLVVGTRSFSLALFPSPPFPRLPPLSLPFSSSFFSSSLPFPLPLLLSISTKASVAKKSPAQSIKRHPESKQKIAMTLIVRRCCIPSKDMPNQKHYSAPNNTSISSLSPPPLPLSDGRQESDDGIQVQHQPYLSPPFWRGVPVRAALSHGQGCAQVWGTSCALQHTAAHCKDVRGYGVDYMCTCITYVQITYVHVTCVHVTCVQSSLKESSTTYTATHCNTLQHTAAHCSTLQHTAIHCKTRALPHQVLCILAFIRYRHVLQFVVVFLRDTSIPITREMPNLYMPTGMRYRYSRYSHTHYSYLPYSHSHYSHYLHYLHSHYSHSQYSPQTSPILGGWLARRDLYNTHRHAATHCNTAHCNTRAL